MRRKDPSELRAMSAECRRFAAAIIGALPSSHYALRELPTSVLDALRTEQTSEVHRDFAAWVLPDCLGERQPCNSFGFPDASVLIEATRALRFVLQ